MSNLVTKELANLLDKSIKEHNVGIPYFANTDYHKLPFESDNFVPILPVESNQKISFVDGGNQEILGAPNFSIQFNRVYFNIFKKNNRILPKSMPSKIEFFSITTSEFRNNEIYYNTKILPLREEFKSFVPRDKHLSFSSMDRTVTLGTQRADIEKVAIISRRFAEWEFSKHIIDFELDKGDIIVRDGALKTSLSNEQFYTKRAFGSAEKKGVVFTGLSKTSALFTNTGLSLLGAVQELAESSNKKGIWYLPIAEVVNQMHNAYIIVVKLHENSKYVFRFEILGTQVKKMAESDICEVNWLLAKNSIDLTFPGYPYGLIDADRFACVSANEIQKYQVMLLSEVSKLGKWKKISKHISSIDAHSILDNLKG